MKKENFRSVTEFAVSRKLAGYFPSKRDIL